ncbi:MAG: hypothetical protein HY050_01765 [Actinobacteria bacterium]|nr:hypothetical protein [Actinomycetota bacterium]
MIQKSTPLIAVTTREEVYPRSADNLCHRMSRANSAGHPLRIILLIVPLA